jgi:hypothetical protein
MSRRLRPLRRAPWWLLLVAGCGSHEHAATRAPDDGAPSDGACALAEQVEVPLDPFGELSDPPRLVPFGDGFAVIDDEASTLDKLANVELVAWQGVDTETAFELGELCPDGVCRNVHGTALLAATAGDPEFLLAEQGSSVSMAAYPLRALAWESDGSAAQITPLFDTRVTAITTRADLQGSRNAERALFVLGNIDVPSLEIVEIATHATLVAPPATMPLPGTPWDCVRVVPTDTAAAISAVTKLGDGTGAVWSVREFDAGANVVFETNAPVPVGDALGFADCPGVVESPEGFHAQWIGTTGESVVATVTRTAEPGSLELLTLDAAPGVLAGVVHGDFVFLSALDAGRQGFVRLDRHGDPGGPGVALPALPQSTPERRRAAPRLLRVADSSLAVSYELENTRVFEQWHCP